jgi:hypothetical protein
MMFVKYNKDNQDGQALVLLLFYVIIAMTLITTAVMLSVSNSLSSMQEEEGGHALEMAESGVENALIRLLRNADYTGETLTIDDGSVTVVVGGSGLKTITSVATKGVFTRGVVATAARQNGILTLLSWREQ